MTGSPLIETDLRIVRERRDLSLDHIQQATRIPIDVLRRFEGGHLVSDPTYNEVYLKAFLRSYAKAVGISQADILTAYDAQRAGRYRGELHPDYEPPKEAPKPVEEEAVTADDAATVQPHVVPSAPAVPPPVQALSTIQPPPVPPKPIASKRVSRPSSPSSRRSFDKNWGTILGLFALVVAVLGTALWALVFRTDSSEDEAELGAAALAETAAADSAAASSGPQFALPIRLTVIAGGDGLQWFRVSENGGERMPHWIDQGASKTFEVDSSLVLWGEGSANAPAFAFQDAVVEWQGMRWTPQSGTTVRIDATSGQRLLDSLAATPKLPPPAPVTP